MKNQFVGLHLDFFGFSASMLCALHCAALPFLLTLAPLAGLQFLDNHWIEYTVILLSLLIASNSLIASYRKNHKRLVAIIVALGGFLLIGFGQISESEFNEALFTSTGGAMIAIAHLINWRLIKKLKEGITERFKVTEPNTP